MQLIESEVVKTSYTRTPRSRRAPTGCTQPATPVCLLCKDHAEPATRTSHRSVSPQTASRSYGAHFLSLTHRQPCAINIPVVDNSTLRENDFSVVRQYCAQYEVLLLLL